MGSDNGCGCCCNTLIVFLLILSIAFVTVNVVHFVQDNDHDELLKQVSNNMTQIWRELTSHNAKTQYDMSSLLKELEAYKEMIEALRGSVNSQHDSISKNTLMVGRLNGTVTNAVKVVEQVNHTIKANSEVLLTMSGKMDNLNQSMSRMDAKATTILNVTQENTKLAQHSMTVMAMMNNTMADNIQSLHTTVTHGTGTILELINNTNGNVVGVSKLAEELKEKLETLLLPLNLTTEILDYLEENSIAIQNLQTDMEHLGTSINLTVVKNDEFLHEEVMKMLILHKNAINQTSQSIIYNYTKEMLQQINNCNTTSEGDNYDIIEVKVNDTNERVIRIEEALLFNNKENDLWVEILNFLWPILHVASGVLMGVFGTYMYTMCRKRKQGTNTVKTDETSDNQVEPVTSMETADLSGNKPQPHTRTDQVIYDEPLEITSDPMRMEVPNSSNDYKLQLQIPPPPPNGSSEDEEK